MGGVSWGRELTKKKTLPRKVACQSSQCMGAGGKRAAGVCISSLKLLKLLIRKHRTSLTSQVNFCKMDSSLGALYGVNKIFQTSKHSIRHCRNDNEVKAHSDGGGEKAGHHRTWLGSRVVCAGLC
nr:uncharacterized protein LOC119626771 [Chlorocebus sabaeus]